MQGEVMAATVVDHPVGLAEVEIGSGRTNELPLQLAIGNEIEIIENERKPARILHLPLTYDSSDE